MEARTGDVRRSRESGVAESFKGFAAESFQFFEELAKNNNKMWFDAHRDQYEIHVVQALRGLLTALEPFLLRLNPHFETSGKTNRNLSRINRDTRFSKDKTPYKSNYYLRVYDSRRSHHADGCLYVGLSADCLTVGFASYAAWGRGPNSGLEAVFRPRFQSQRSQFDRLLDQVVRKKRYETYWHRQEKGEWAQHPGLPRNDTDWLSLQAWIVRRVFLPGARQLRAPAFAQTVKDIFSDLYPLYVFTSSPNSKRQVEPRRLLRTRNRTRDQRSSFGATLRK
jgi:uncharacterized protein (TIGR02453 family)